VLKSTVWKLFKTPLNIYSRGIKLLLNCLMYFFSFYQNKDEKYGLQAFEGKTLQKKISSTEMLIQTA